MNNNTLLEQNFEKFINTSIIALKNEKETENTNLNDNIKNLMEEIKNSINHDEVIN